MVDGAGDDASIIAPARFVIELRLSPARITARIAEAI